jgi:glutathione peroxidase
MSSLHDFEVPSIQGETVRLADYAGQLCLVVNVASQCGLTPQYAGLENLHEEIDGLTVLGFPCNQFGAQEPGTDAQICEFATSKYGARFPMFSKIEVNGEGASPVYQFLKSGHPDEDGNEDIAWNFTKFLVGRDGQVLQRFAPQVTPDEIAEAVKAHL